jgi:hypothetical protein
VRLLTKDDINMQASIKEYRKIDLWNPASAGMTGKK